MRLHPSAAVMAALAALLLLAPSTTFGAGVSPRPPAPTRQSPQPTPGGGSWTCIARARSLSHPGEMVSFTARRGTRSDATNAALEACRGSHRADGGTCQAGRCRQPPR